MRYKLLFSDAGYQVISIETFWEMIGTLLSISYKGALAHAPSESGTRAPNRVTE